MEALFYKPNLIINSLHVQIEDVVREISDDIIKKVKQEVSSVNQSSQGNVTVTNKKRKIGYQIVCTNAKEKVYMGALHGTIGVIYMLLKAV